MDETAGIAARLALDDAADLDRFTSRERTHRRHIFGGLVVAQALGAAARTVDLPVVGSLQASFLSRGTPGDRILHEVERTRDGRSVASRRVVARQGDDVLLVLHASFHLDEEGADFAPGPTDVPGPESGLRRGRYHSTLFASYDLPPDGLVRRAWLRLRDPIGDEPILHAQTLAFLSDLGPTRAIRQPHAALSPGAGWLSLTLDHTVWFHRAARADGWLLSELEVRATGNGRGLALGSIRAEDGTLLATVAQQALLRTRR